MAQDRIDPNAIRWQSTPSQEREARGEEADIGQSQASAASSAASAQRSAALLPADVRQAEIDAEKAAIDLDEARRALATAQRRGQFREAVRADDARALLANISRARQLLQEGLATGPVAQFSGNMWGSPAAELWGSDGQGGLRSSITGPGVMNALAASREGSAAGATPFGQLAIREMELVRSLQGNFGPNVSAEENIRALDQIERQARRSLAYDLGIDPRTAEGARYVGLPYDPSVDPERNPRGAAAADASLFGGEAPFSYILPPPGEDTPPPTGGGAVERGEWTSNPELSGVDGAVTALIRQGVAQGRPAAEIEAGVRQYLDSVQPGLGDRAGNVTENIRYHQETGNDPQVTIERSYQSAGERPGAGTAYALGAADLLTGGYLDELTGKGAEMRAVEEENPGAYFTGQMTGGVLTSLLGGAGAARAGLNVPWYLQGGAANAIYGSGSADEGNRLVGAGVGAASTPFMNVAGQALMRPFASAVRGTTDEGARQLARRYGVELSPGNVSPGGAMSWLENRMADIPVASGAVQRRADEAVGSFNEAAFNRALEPIGGGTQGTIGRDGVALANQQVDAAYRQALDGVNITVDPARVFDDSWLQGIEGPAADSARRQLATMRNNLVSPNNTMTGAQIQEAKQSLQALRQSLGNADGIEPAIVNRVNDLQDELYDAFQTQAPDNFARFRAADQAFGNMQTLQNAVTMSPGSRIDAEAGRTFLPSGLNAQARQGDIRYRGRRATSEGEGTFAEMADLGERLVQPRGPGSLRGALATGTALGLPAAAYMLAPSASGSDGGEGEGGSSPVPAEGNGAVPASLAYSALLSPLLALPFTRGGSRAYSRMMTADRSPAMQQLGDMLLRYAPSSAAAALGRPAMREIVEPVYPDPIALGNVGVEQAAAPQGAPPVDTGAPSTAQTGELQMNGRRVRYDPATDSFVDLDTGETVGDPPQMQYRHGGSVAKRPVPTRALKG